MQVRRGSGRWSAYQSELMNKFIESMEPVQSLHSIRIVLPFVFTEASLAGNLKQNLTLFESISRPSITERESFTHLDSDLHMQRDLSVFTIYLYEVPIHICIKGFRQIYTTLWLIYGHCSGRTRKCFLNRLLGPLFGPLNGLLIWKLCACSSDKKVLTRSLCRVGEARASSI